jgi:hypothetical protein
MAIVKMIAVLVEIMARLVYMAILVYITARLVYIAMLVRIVATLDETLTKGAKMLAM